MTLLKIVILAAIQGAAELLPVSSSAHVVVAEHLLGMDPSAPEMTFLLVMLHTGTMFAVLFYFWPRWKALFASNGAGGNFVRNVAVATVVTGVIGFGLKIFIEKFVLERWLHYPHGEIESLFRLLPLVSCSLLAGGLLILVSSFFDGRSNRGVNRADSVVIGGIQALCLPFRGFSRSGATISTALIRGVSRAQAEDFSFALAVLLTPPVILLELRRLLHSGGETHMGLALVGAVFSFLAGLLALRWLSSWLENGRWRYFGIYCIAGAAAVWGLLGGPMAHASEIGQLVYGEDPSRIDHLELPIGKPLPVVEIRTSTGGTAFAAVVEGNFVHQYWSLLLGKAIVAQDSEGNFVVKIPITSGATQATFFAVGPLGEIQRETVVIRSDVMSTANKKGETTPLPQMNVGLGFTSINYHEYTPGASQVSPYSAIALTAKFGLTKKFEDSNWGFGATLFYNLLPLEQSRSPTARFLGVNLRVGYTIPQISDPWRLTIYGGFYYLTMFIQTSDPTQAYGFSNVAGPQLYPVLTRALKGDATISAYAKFSPISDSFSLLSLGSHELAGGLIYSFPLSNGHPFAYTLDVSNLALTLTDLPPPFTTTTFSSTTVSLGVSYGL